MQQGTKDKRVRRDKQERKARNKLTIVAILRRLGASRGRVGIEQGRITGCRKSLTLIHNLCDCFQLSGLGVQILGPLKSGALYGGFGPSHWPNQV